eukprot:GHVU01151089.1.p1 GENE.GHVU01151089.1~~GHVU01151089.1.p1  ORF type:complete len:434 (-),score=49.38 GHVU01151089.1:69-1370(-)
MVVTPPYTSEANGVVERAIREVRALLRTALYRLSLPFSVWPAVLVGVVSLHNKLYSPALKSSPWKKRYGFAPSLQNTIGDPVILKPRSGPDAGKTLQLPGRRMVFLAAVNASTALAYDQETSTLYRTHPSQLRFLPVADPEAGPMTDPTPTTGSVTPRPVPQKPSARMQSGGVLPRPAPLIFEGSSSSSESSDDASLPLAEGEAEMEVPPPAAEMVGLDPLEPAVAEPRMVPPLAERARERRAGPQTRGGASPLHSPRLAGRDVVIIRGYTGNPAPALLLQRGVRSTSVAWLRPVDGGAWVEGELGWPPTTSILAEGTLDERGRLPAELQQALGGSDREAVDLGIETANEDCQLCVSKEGQRQWVLTATTPWPPDEKYERATLKEFVAILRNGVIGNEVPPQEADRRNKAMRMNWRLTGKMDEGTGKTVPKAR